MSPTKLLSVPAFPIFSMVSHAILQPQPLFRLAPRRPRALDRAHLALSNHSTLYFYPPTQKRAPSAHAVFADGRAVTSVPAGHGVGVGAERCGPSRRPVHAGEVTQLLPVVEFDQGWYPGFSQAVGSRCSGAPPALSSLLAVKRGQLCIDAVPGLFHHPAH